MPDYAAKARALRAKAADPVVSEEERRALLGKAAELEAKYGKFSSSFTDNTTVLGRDGRPAYGTQAWESWAEAMREHRKAQATKVAEDLLRNQWRWNTEYYDRDGNPRGNEADLDDLYDDMYKYAPEDDDEDLPDPEPYWEQS